MNIWKWDELKREWKRPWKIPKFIFNNIKYSWQRITKGYCDKDLWNIDYWFMSIMPDMLQKFKNTRHGSPSVLGEDYVDENGILNNDTCHENWDIILEKMIFLFREMNEETCERKNIYEEEHEKVYREFEKKYGILGEGLESVNEKLLQRKKVHFPSELPEYKDIEMKYSDYEKELCKYRETCKDEAFQLFSKWFYHLWD